MQLNNDFENYFSFKCQHFNDKHAGHKGYNNLLSYLLIITWF